MNLGYQFKIKLDFYLLNITRGKVIICIILVLLCAFIINKIYLKQNMSKLYMVLFTGVITLIISLTILGREFGQAENSLNTLFETYRVLIMEQYSLELYEIILNIILFAPLGVLLAHKFERKIVVFTGFGVSLFVELAQLITGTGVFEIPDILHNTIGTLSGYALYRKTVIMHNKYKTKRPGS